MAIEQDWRNSGKYYPSPESAVEMRSIARYGVDAQTTVRMMVDHKVWRMKQKMEAHGERF